LEKEVVTFATQLGFTLKPQVSVQQLQAIEINPYAFELAQVSVQIGFLQWRRDNGFNNDRSPVLQNLDGFQNEDALFVARFGRKPKTLKEAQADEHTGDHSLKSHTEREWPKCGVIVSNPPFLGNKRLRSELGNAYTASIFQVFGNRLPATSDFCCYWFEKARDLIERGRCQRAGLLATTGSKQVSSRAAFERIKDSGKIFFAISDRGWFDKGTAIRICMVGFAGREATDKPILDGQEVLDIHPDLTGGLDTTGKRYLSANRKLCFMGTTKVGDFDLPAEKALALLAARNSDALPNSDVVRPFRNGSDLVRQNSNRWIVDFGVGCTNESAARYRLPFQHVVENVKEKRERNNDRWRRFHWWLLGRTLPDFREATARLGRYLGTARVAKHRIFLWLDAAVLPDSKVIAIAFDDDYRFGILHSHVHEIWTLATCGWHGKGNDATNNPTECFETFPFPFPDDLQLRRLALVPLSAEPQAMELNGGMAKMVKRRFLELKEEPPPYGRGAGGEPAPSSSVGGDQSRLTSAARMEALRAAIAAAAKDLTELRERWLNPPEWIERRFIEFPASVDGPWSRYIEPSSIREPRSSLGLVRFPRLEPRDAECAARLKKRTLTNLYNERPAWLDRAHKKLDAAVAAAYGWPDDLTEDDILERLLALNLERAAEEAKAQQPKASREKHDSELL
jgi:hypothetical protein